MADATAIIFVPGAWHSPNCFDVVRRKLDGLGYTTDYVHLPSVGPAEYPKNFDKDVQQIKSQLESLADSGYEIVAVVHSYGSIPTNEAIKGLDVATRKEQGKVGGIKHIFFCCSFVLPEGKSLNTASGGNDLPWFVISEDRLEVKPATPVETFYNDMPEADAKAAAAHLKPHSYQTFHSPCTYAAWRKMPSTYLYCTKDEAIPIQFQKIMVEEFAKGVNFRIEELDASHSPFFSMPDETAAAIRRAAELPA